MDPRQKLRGQLKKLLSEWIQKGDRALLLLDANNHMRTGKMAKLLQTLVLRDVIREQVNQPDVTTNFQGRDQIDGIWATSNLICTRDRFHPFWSGVGGHRLLSADFTQESLVGCNVHKISRLRYCRLQCDDSRGQTHYLNEVLCIWHAQGMDTKTWHLFRMA